MRACMGRCLLALVLPGFSAPLAAGEVTVAAASSLVQVLRELEPAFATAHPSHTWRLTFGASDALLQQVARGAPVDVLITADTESMDRAQARGLIAPGSRAVLTQGRLVLIAAREPSVAVHTLADLTQPALRRLVMGNPASVPAGRYARDALQAQGLWPALSPKTVLALSVRQALDLVARGEVDAGFVYATDAKTYGDRVRVVSEVPTQHPVRYWMARVTAARADGVPATLAFLASAPAQAVFARHGFDAVAPR